MCLWLAFYLAFSHCVSARFPFTGWVPCCTTHGCLCVASSHEGAREWLPVLVSYILRWGSFWIRMSCRREVIGTTTKRWWFCGDVRMRFAVILKACYSNWRLRASFVVDKPNSEQPTLKLDGSTMRMVANLLSVLRVHDAADGWNSGLLFFSVECKYWR
jgi:hypothetical protein